MIDKDKEVREHDKQDARDVAEFFNSKRREMFFNNLIGVAMAGYINGVNDACRLFDVKGAASS